MSDVMLDKAIAMDLAGVTDKLIDELIDKERAFWKKTFLLH